MAARGKQILQILLVLVISRCKCELTNGYSHSNRNSASQIGSLLKPPPLPALLPLVPVPFHGGAGRIQRQNIDVGYQYQPPPPPPHAPSPQTTDFKFPAPFYKQYNFNFVPPPQPFTTTPSPSIFQKVSGWLFPSKEVAYEAGLDSSNNIAPLQKDCNPCNLVPWIPVIRYNGLGAEKAQQSPTYGPPSPTAYASLQENGQYRPQNLNTNNLASNSEGFSTGVPHQIYGPPKQFRPQNSFRSISSTYGPPSPTHTISFSQENSLSNTYSETVNSYDSPSSAYGTPSTPIAPLSSSYSLPVSFNSVSSSTYRIPTSSYSFKSSPYDNTNFISTTYSPLLSNYYPGVLNKELPSQSDVEVLHHIKPATELELPKVTSPTGFKNSYGEIITNTYALDIPYSVSATAAESNKVKTEVLPYDGTKLVTPNTSVALANPAPFTLNRGRNIHTLQPVALPNLSVSPLPPIFNARPFRPISTHFPTNMVQGINTIQPPPSNVNVAKSVPVAEFTHSVEYPTTVIQSPIIDIDISKPSNHTKAYRNIPSRFVINDIRDISPQASEDHISAAKSQQDTSFESTGPDFGNDLYEISFPIGLKPSSQMSSNHKSNFADLRGLKDEDVDKYRTESNLQNIDSPLLYLKPSAPHKSFENFVTLSTPKIENEYEIYDEVPTTTLAPQHSTFTSAWDESRTYYSDLLPPKKEQGQNNQAKVIQIIVPYTTGKKNSMESWPKDWNTNSEEDFVARKVQSNTENYNFATSTSTESSIGTSTEDSSVTVTEHSTDIERLKTPAIINDLYDVKEPPFDIIKLQHTIDDWTEQEYSNSKYFRYPQGTRSNEKYAKQIPDDYFTTTLSPVENFFTNNYNYDIYDHEVSSSIQHTVTDSKNDSLAKPLKEYNSIERTRNNFNSGKNDKLDEIKKLHIYTAASSFRISTTTPAPWSEVQTSISPLTKEKVYVVTSKPWREKPKAPEYDYEVESFESKKTNSDNTASETDDLSFKSPRFSNRPSFGFSSAGTQDHYHLDTSKEWHHSINDLWSRSESQQDITLFDGSDRKDEINLEEDAATPKTTAA